MGVGAGDGSVAGAADVAVEGALAAAAECVGVADGLDVGVGIVVLGGEIVFGLLLSEGGDGVLVACDAAETPEDEGDAVGEGVLQRAVGASDWRVAWWCSAHSWGDSSLGMTGEVL